MPEKSENVVKPNSKTEKFLDSLDIKSSEMKKKKNRRGNKQNKSKLPKETTAKLP